MHDLKAARTYEAACRDYGVKCDSVLALEWDVLHKESPTFLLQKHIVDALVGVHKDDKINLRVLMLPIQATMKEHTLDPRLFNTMLLDRYKNALRLR